MALLRYVEEHGKTTGLSSPGGVVLWSPWLALDKSYYNPAGLFNSPNEPTDYINDLFGHWGAECMTPAPSTGMDLHDPYLSPLGHPFKTSAPVCISTGESEVLLHDDNKLAEEMKGIRGNIVDFQIQANAIHDIILVGDKVGFEEEAELAAKKVDEFLRANM